MRRHHYESDEMKQDFKKLKAQGVDHFLCHVRKPDGIWLRPQIKNTAQGVSSYCNRMYTKYGDGTYIDVVYPVFTETKCELKTYCTYG